MKEILEDGKRYLIDDAGMVVEASAVTQEEEESPVDERPLALSERVEVEGKLGKVASRVPSVYGLVLGVRFDDGSVGEYLEDMVKRSSEEVVRYDQPIDEVKGEWETYQGMPQYTAEEVEKKSAVARRLNVTAKALVTDSRTPLSDRVVLDHIIITTGADILDMREQEKAFDLDAHADYLNGLPKYKLPEEVINSTSRSSEDVSWLLAAAEDAAEELGSIDWDQHLQNEAIRATSKLTEEQLQSDEFMNSVAVYREQAQPIGFNDQHRATFREYLNQARVNTLTERQTYKMARTAKVEEELTDFDTAQLFL